MFRNLLFTSRIFQKHKLKAFTFFIFIRKLLWILAKFQMSAKTSIFLLLLIKQLCTLLVVPNKLHCISGRSECLSSVEGGSEDLSSIEGKRFLVEPFPAITHLELLVVFA